MEALIRSPALLVERGVDGHRDSREEVTKLSVRRKGRDHLAIRGLEAVHLREPRGIEGLLSIDGGELEAIERREELGLHQALRERLFVLALPDGDLRSRGGIDLALRGGDRQSEERIVRAERDEHERDHRKL